MLMSIRIFGVGLGVFLLSAIWVLCILGCLSATRKKGIQFGIVYPFLGSIITVLLLVWPRQQCSSGPSLENVGRQNAAPLMDEQGEEQMVEKILGVAEDAEEPPIENDEIDWLAIPRLVLITALGGLLAFAMMRQLHDSLFRPMPLPPLKMAKTMERKSDT